MYSFVIKIIELLIVNLSAWKTINWIRREKHTKSNHNSIINKKRHFLVLINRKKSNKFIHFVESDTSGLFL